MRRITEPTWVNGFAFGLDAIQFYPPGSELNYRAGPDGEWVAIECDESLLQEAARKHLGRELPLPRDGACNFQVCTAERAALDQIVQRSFRLPATSLSQIGPILGAAAELLSHAQAGLLSVLARRWRERQTLLNRAEQFLRASAGRPFDSRALATAAGASERTLQLHFLEAYGMTPGGWARCRALHRVRDRLLKTDPERFTVEGVAQECGFRHMGRFAAYYAELFGECPSATLSRLTRGPGELELATGT